MRLVGPADTIRSVPRVLLLLPTSTYRSADYLRAAERLGVETIVASERPSTLESLNPSGLMTIDFRDPDDCERAARELARDGGVDAAVGVDEETAVAAARIAASLGLVRSNPPEAVAAARDKRILRERLIAAGLPSPVWVLGGALRGRGCRDAPGCVSRAC